MRRLVKISVLLVSVTTFAIAACVADAPNTSTINDSDGSSGDGSSTADGSTNGDGSSGCTSTQTACGSSCVVLDTDKKNCGVCGHDCLGGMCSGGACQATELFSGKSADASVGGVAAIAVDSSNIFWVTPAPVPHPGDKPGTIPSTIYRCGVGADCSVPAMYWQQQGEIDSLSAATTPGSLFFTDNFNGYIDRISSAGVDAGASPAACTAGGSPCLDVFVAAQYPNTLAVGGTDVFAGSSTNQGTAGSAQIYYGSVNGSGAAGSALTNVVSGNPASTGLALDDAENYIYAAMSNGTIYIYPSTGTANGPLNTITGQTTVGQMLIANGYLFWTNPSAGKLFAIAHCVGTSCNSGGPSPIPPQTFASAPGSLALSVDAKNIYWSANGQIFSCSLNGCPDAGPTMLASGTVTVRAIANDATSIYWGDDSGSIYQLAK